MYNKGKEPNWGDWKVKACVEALEYYRSRDWIKEKVDYEISFNQLLTVMLKHYTNKELIVKKIITKNLDFKVFLYLHTVFQIYQNTDDWLLNTVRDNIAVTPDELREYMKKKDVPKDILNKFKILNPQPIFFEFEPVKILFGFWQRDENGRMCDPVRVVDKSALGKHGEGKGYYIAESFISKFKIIDLKTWIPDDSIVTWDQYKKGKEIDLSKLDEKIEF